MGLLTFGNQAIVRWTLITYSNVDSLVIAINSDDTFPAGSGNTNMYDGLYRMRTELFSPNHGSRPDVPHIAIVITDGHATRNVHLTIPEAQRCWEAGIQVLLVHFSACSHCFHICLSVRVSEHGTGFTFRWTLMILLQLCCKKGGPLLRRTRHFFPSSGHNHRQYSLLSCSRRTMDRDQTSQYSLHLPMERCWETHTASSFAEKIRFWTI